ncbi:hypothetical protein SNOG_08639 [Parastagonospora nodorum SN15]|uniref:Uncharacterized protein n=1 Tax=Phaeosphaeria nodorum (strain SN15 / ATCC MYA-4574 / FGSC 10173) TaxID=321614 RepID=Q0UHX5_PHANO|nr:hypothetical protein SNOG_08639 [Parastagonospora nodorum SN15]EAT83807.1 hypothetical protein SNOG_08639 [Parastagonospora nodorum SN15]
MSKTHRDSLLPPTQPAPDYCRAGLDHTQDTRDRGETNTNEDVNIREPSARKLGLSATRSSLRS